MYYNVKYTQEDVNLIVSNKLKETFLLLTGAIFLTILTAMFVSSNPSILNTVINMMAVVLILQVVIAVSMSVFVFKISKSTLVILLYVYAILTGFSLSLVTLVYTVSSVIYVLLGTLVLFATLAIYGYVTKKDLATYSSFLLASIIAIIVVSLINIFLRSSLVDMLLSVFGVFIFMVYTAYDVNQIKKNIYLASNNGNDLVLEKVSVIGAFSLYIDFINLFIYLLKLFGKEE
ncbi:Bax inhibitor-1/YccA family protein [Oceanivirga miroungae]|uniref:Inner membrane protein YbhL n=1 Tax=Oceanivirga miroungae TaxID=1130046 RepID=A0A6I8M793_9FUSO|nr:Bax inhibitor-1/YccA family protein [Oceanivirga miroungae]VWL85286.1 Inner membrane protein YbhL [Oceanivirga miroungae]